MKVSKKRSAPSPPHHYLKPFAALILPLGISEETWTSARDFNRPPLQKVSTTTDGTLFTFPLPDQSFVFVHESSLTLKHYKENQS